MSTEVLRIGIYTTTNDMIRLGGELAVIVGTLMYLLCEIFEICASGTRTQGRIIHMGIDDSMWN